VAAPIADTIAIEFPVGKRKQKGSISADVFNRVRGSPNVAAYRDRWQWPTRNSKTWLDFLAHEIFTGHVRVPSGGAEFPSDAV